MQQRSDVRAKRTVPADIVEINKGTWSSSSSKAKGPTESPCSGSGPTYYTATGKFSEGPELEAPVSDSSVKAYSNQATNSPAAPK